MQVAPRQLGRRAADARQARPDIFELRLVAENREFEIIWHPNAAIISSASAPAAIR
jgi:hypothetical protein